MRYSCILSLLFLIPNTTRKNFKAETRAGRLISREDLLSVKVDPVGLSVLPFQRKKTNEVIMLLLLSNAPMMMRIYAASGSVVGNYLLFWMLLHRLLMQAAQHRGLAQAALAVPAPSLPRRRRSRGAEMRCEQPKFFRWRREGMPPAWSSPGCVQSDAFGRVLIEMCFATCLRNLCLFVPLKQRGTF